MNAITSEFILSLSAAIVGVSMALSGLLLIGFRRGRLRGYNIYIVFSIALLGFVRFVEYATGDIAIAVVLLAWGNLALGSLIGLAGMLKIAKSDPPVFGSR